MFCLIILIKTFVKIKQIEGNSLASMQLGDKKKSHPAQAA